jgi:prepilin-type N-terminal cleavage/methylation domain-containing protein
MHLRPVPRRPQGGFTLIELLIVVAIIAILAAIAVPNFLAAQTRSKVSRVLSELRTARTGVEAYAVDYNKLPPMTWPTFVPGLNTPPGDRYRNQPITGTMGPRLTTPVAYLTRFDFLDPFAQGKEGTIYVDFHLYTYFDYPTYARPKSAGGQAFYNPSSFQLALFRRNLGDYLLLSIGPAGDDSMSFNEFYTQYDPSNGTVSPGTIFVSQKHSEPVMFK